MDEFTEFVMELQERGLNQIGAEYKLDDRNLALYAIAFYLSQIHNLLLDKEVTFER